MSVKLDELKVNILTTTNSAIFQGGNTNAPLILKSGANAYREGLRIIPSGNWSDIVLAGSDAAEASGTSANSWFIGNNNGNFYISRNGSNSSSSAMLSCVNNVWSWNGTATGNIDGTATSANYIKLYEARGTTTTLNKVANYVTAGAMFHLVASSSTSATDNGKTPTDANILQMNWDNNGGYDAQIAVSTSANRMYFRDQPSAKKAWQEVAHAQVGTSNIGSATQPVYMTSTGVITKANNMVSHLGNAGKSNMNDVGRLHASVGMTSLADPSNNTDNPMNDTTKSTGWHLYWNANYADDPNGSNAWVAQIVNKAGTAQWWVRSRSGGTITNGTAWAADWKHLVVSPQTGQGSSTVPIYIDANGHTQSITSYSGNAETATTATNLANNPSIQASTSNANQVTITAGGKTSSAYTVPYATSAGSATSATTATYIKCTDTRNATLNPTDLTAAQGVRFDFKAKGTIDLTATDAYAGVMSFRPYGSNTDWSGGNAHQLAFNSEGLHWRNGGTSWGNWYQILDSNNTTTGTNNTATLTWNTAYTIAKINGIDIKFTTMAKPSYAFTDLTAHPTTLSGYGITDAKIASGVITLGSNTITPVTSVNGHSGSSVSVTASDLGLASALKYVGTKSSLPTATDSTTYSTYNNGDVITVSAKEYAYIKGSNAAGSSWVELGDEGSYKLKQTAFANSTGTADGANTSTSFIYSFSQNENGAISDIKTRQLPTLTNVSYTATTDNYEYPILMKYSTGSDTTAAGVRFANTTNKMTTINPSTGMITAPGLTLASNAATAHLVFSRAGWNYVTMPNNDSSVISIGYGTQADNTTQRLVIYKTGTVRPGANGSQNLGDDTHKWNKVYGVNFYGTFNGTATSAQQLAAREIDNSDLNQFSSGGALKYAWVSGGNNILSKPTDVNAFGVIVMKTAASWTGQLLMSTDSEPGLYWRTNLTTETPTYGAWAKVWDSSNHRVFYGTCAEAAGTATKPVVCTDYDEMKVGDIITVKFDNTNTAASPTLNVNGKGSKSVKMAYSGGTADLSSYTQLAGIRTFIYDGTNWILQEGECVKQGVTDTTSDIWRPVMLGAYNSTDVRQAPEQRYAMIHAARNVKYHQTTGTLRAPILKTPKLLIEQSFEDKAHIEWNDTDSSIDFIFD